MGVNWILGWYLDVVYVFKNFLENYMVIMMQVSEFVFIVYSKLMYNEVFCVN